MTATWPFVGRTAELARAESLLNAGTGVVIAGEAGIGKSALARQIMRRAADRGARVGLVEGHAAADGIPFGAFAGVLADVMGTEPPVHPAEVARRIPGVLGAVPGDRIVLVVDDAHLLDDSSPKVLLVLASGMTATVVMTIRQPGPPPGGVRRLWLDGLCERVDVPAMPGEDADGRRRCCPGRGEQALRELRHAPLRCRSGRGGRGRPRGRGFGPRGARQRTAVQPAARAVKMRPGRGWLEPPARPR